MISGLTELLITGALMVAGVLVSFFIGAARGASRKEEQQRLEQLKREQETGERVDEALDKDAGAAAAGESWLDRMRKAGQ